MKNETNEIKIHCKYDELLNISELKNHPRNRNKHPKEQIERLAKLYTYHGVRHPIIVSKKSGLIVAGHGRKEAAKKAGLKTFPIVYQDFIDDDAEYSFIQSDNAIGSWSELDLEGITSDLSTLDENFDYEMLGLKDFNIEQIESKPQCDEDEVPEHVEPKTKIGDIYKLGNHRLMCGDSTIIDHVDKLMNGEKADMVFTDPPYGISVVSKDGSLGVTTKGKYKQVIGDETTDAAVDSYNLCAGLDIKTLIFWGGNHYSSNLPDSTCWIVWDKQAGKRVTFADCELAWTNIKKPVRMFTHIWDGFRRDSERGEMRVHPTQKPVKLIEDIFELFKEECGEKCLDLFGGSGSTLIACEKTNRKCFMMELDPHYCDVIVARWEKFTGKKAELING